MNSESAQANSHMFVTAYDDHLSNTTSNHFFLSSQMKENLSTTTTTKLYPAKKWKTNIRQQCIKINISLILFTSATYLLLYSAKFFLMSIKIAQFLKLYKII